MSSLLLTSNRSYLKIPIYKLYRQLSLHEPHANDQVVSTNSQTDFRSSLMPMGTCRFARNELSQKRYITLSVPSSGGEKSSSNVKERIPLQFPPGNPNDRPKLEHLRFIEDQLIQVLPEFCKQIHPYALYTSDVIFENYYDDPPKIMNGIGSYALVLFWIRAKLKFKLMNVNIHLLKTTIDEESDCVKIRWRITGLSNSSLLSVLKGWRKPKDVIGNIGDYIEYIDGLSIFYVRGNGRIYKHRVDRIMVDEDKELATSRLNKKRLTATAPVSV